MRLNKILIMGIVSMSVMGTANAAVYGTLKNDVEVRVVQDVAETDPEESSEETFIPLEKGDLVKIIAKQDEAYIIASDENIQKVINIEDIDLVGKLAYTTADETKLREEASPIADIIGFFEKGQLVLVLERQDDFYKIKVNDQEGYIYKSQLEEDGLDVLPYTKTEPAAQSAPQVKGQETNRGEEVVAYARRFLGGRYVFGGNSLTNGVDCSGFTQQIMRHFGVNIERSSRAQYAANGYRVSEKDLLPGDLVFYGSNGKRIDHVAIYAGNGQIIHASDAKSGIKMSALHYGKPLIGMKRVLN
ncbi:C40 family peptidase [Cellulosilyticum sp. I15G10I2]|uniref:C40 family peptidase n=1 Tax=Cellulosilyticum sp. I15G10I2 TaxID=1892843 RepID=UPI00085C18DA|nr:C40 family peptidase [Cellulosilyticum sp. I15G10I2]